jgi:hypothetical protein
MNSNFNVTGDGGADGALEAVEELALGAVEAPASPLLLEQAAADSSIVADAINTIAFLIDLLFMLQSPPSHLIIY